jgi:FkbM family methyltransferase
MQSEDAGVSCNSPFSENSGSLRKISSTDVDSLIQRCIDIWSAGMRYQLQYKIRGLGYWLECLNPLSSTIRINELPLRLELQAYKRDALGRGLYRRRCHEPGVTKLLLTRFASNAERNFIDVGANIGYFSCLMSILAGPTGRVLAIEPEPNNVKLLESNVKINHLTNVEIHACASGAGEGSAMLGLYKSSNRGRHSIVDLDMKSAIKVPIRRLDDLTRKFGNGATSWSLVKIDVEGYEPFVIEGANETLSRTQTLVIEYSPHLLRKAGVDPASLFDALSTHFSRVFRFENTDLVEVTVKDCLASEIQVELVFER